MTTEMITQLVAMHDGTADKLAWHRQMMADNAGWLDAVPGRRAEAEQIAVDLERFAANIRDDLGVFATGEDGHLIRLAA